MLGTRKCLLRSPVSNRPNMPDRTAWHNRLCGGDDGMGVDAEMAVEIGDRCRSGRNARRPASGCGGRSTEPSQASVAGWPSITVTRPQWDGTSGEQPLDMAAGMGKAVLAGTAGGGPAGIQPVGGGDGQEADIAPVLGHQPDGLDRFRRDGPGIGDDDLRIRPGPPHPIGAVDDVARQARRRSRASADRSVRVDSRR